MTPIKISVVELDAILAVVERQTGLNFRPDQFAPVSRIVQRMMVRFDVERPTAFLRALDRRDIFEALIDEITIGESYFFRAPLQFDYLRDHILPSQIEKLEAGQKIRIWSTACAGGEEPYSIAIVCAQLGLLDRVDLLATDISPKALAKAREATFRDWAFRGDALTMVKHFMSRSGEQWVLNDRLKRTVRFQQLNLAAEEYSSAIGPSRFAIVFCRNVLIYFKQAMIQHVATRLFESLAPGGWLITAAADPPLSNWAAFQSIETAQGFFYRRPAESSVASTGPSQVSAVLASQSPLAQATAIPAARASSVARQDTRSVESTGSSVELPTAQNWISKVRRLASSDRSEALEECYRGVQLHPLSVELHYLHAHLYLQAGEVDTALREAKRACFLDKSAIMVQFLLGLINFQRGEWQFAERHFVRVVGLCAPYPPESEVPLAPGETMAQVVAAAKSHMMSLNMNHER